MFRSVRFEDTYGKILNSENARVAQGGLGSALVRLQPAVFLDKMSHALEFIILRLMDLALRFNEVLGDRK
jgi:hypothetical protein